MDKPTRTLVSAHCKLTERLCPVLDLSQNLKIQRNPKAKILLNSKIDRKILWKTFYKKNFYLENVTLDLSFVPL